MSVIAAGEAVAIRRRGIPGLRGTGWVGHVCAGVIVFALLIAVIGPHIAPYDPNFIQLRYAYVGPVGDHYLGFDGRGRDLLSRLLCGAQTPCSARSPWPASRSSSAPCSAIVAAWRGGWLDTTPSARCSTSCSRSPASSSPSWPPPCSGRA